VGMVWRVWGECLCGVRGVIVESGVVGLGCGCVGDLGRGQKKLYYLVAPFEIADFRGE
jgi:hypothetical protein